MINKKDIEAYITEIRNKHLGGIQVQNNQSSEIEEFIMSSGFAQRELYNLSISPEGIRILVEFFDTVLPTKLKDSNFLFRFIEPLTLFLELDYNSKDFLDREYNNREKLIKENDSLSKETLDYFKRRQCFRKSNRLKGDIGLAMKNDRIHPGIDRRKIKGIIYYYYLFKENLNNENIQFTPLVDKNKLSSIHQTKIEKDNLIKMDVNTFICHITFALGIKFTEEKIRKIIRTHKHKFSSSKDVLCRDKIILESEAILWRELFYRVKSKSNIPTKNCSSLEFLIVRFKRSSILEVFHQYIDLSILQNQIAKQYGVQNTMSTSILHMFTSDISMRNA